MTQPGNVKQNLFFLFPVRHRLSAGGGVLRMKLPEIRVGAGALLLCALLIYISPPGGTSALLPCVLVHELGHLAALRLLRIPVRRLTLELSGLRIDCAGAPGTAQDCLAALAGPAAGLLYALLLNRLGHALGSRGALLSAGISLLLSAFNLLPVPPLDGGRVFAALSASLLGAEAGERLTRCVGLLGAALVLSAGAWLCLRGRGPALAAAGLFLLAGLLRDGTED